MSALFFVGSYTIEMGHIPDPRGAGITAHVLDLTTGSVRQIGNAPASITGENPTYICHTDVNTLCSVSEVVEGEVKALNYKVDENLTECSFRLINALSTKGADPCHLVSQKFGDSKMLYCANYSGGNVSVISMNKDNSLGELVQDLKTADPMNPVNIQRQEKSHPHQCVLYKNDYLLVPNLGVDRIQIYPLQADGKVLPEISSSCTVCSPGDGPRHMILHQSLPIAYFIQELSSKVVVCSIELAETGLSFTKIQEISTLPDDFKGENITAAIRLDNAGKFLYGSNRGHNSLAVFSIDQATGALTFVSHVPTQDAPRDFAIAPTGKMLVVANQNSHTLVTYNVNGDGTLTQVNEIFCGSPVAVLFAQ
eukprot:TRINITY_DN2786_c0_g1_i1.p1 TRINITY_DN2786_c0_g1~~TRINITY_DN2786_c0_g1_i1.p1  ORF type:complete len:366 (-),score=69.39 TRINITY_DN2786_c0_g1_i1:26-1123(-)